MTYDKPTLSCSFEPEEMTLTFFYSAQAQCVSEVLRFRIFPKKIRVEGMRDDPLAISRLPHELMSRNEYVHKGIAQLPKEFAWEVHQAFDEYIISQVN